MVECDSDFLPQISSIPGPRGAPGPAGPAGASAVAGKNSFTTTTAPFVMPAAGGAVTVTVADTSWVAAGQTLFVESAGYFNATTVLSATALSLTAQAVPGNAVATTAIASGRKVGPAGIAYIDTSALDDLDERITVLENSPGGIRSFRSSSAPAGPFRVGDLWFQTDGAGATIARFRWDGTGWAPLDDADTAGLADDLADLTTGVNVINSQVTALKQEHVLAVVGSGADKRVAGFRVTVPGGGSAPTEFVVQADKFVILGADGTGRKSPFYVLDGVTYIDEAVIPELTADKIAVNGDFQTVNLGTAGRLFHPGITPRRYFRSVDFGTSFADGKVFSSGNALSVGYAHATPVTGYAPGNGGWTSGGLTACPDSDGKVRVQIQGRLIGYTGNILLYGQINNGTPFALAARSSNDGGSAYIDCNRVLAGVGVNDLVKLYVAPADGAGAVAGATCRYEIDVTFFNW